MRSQQREPGSAAPAAAQRQGPERTCVACGRKTEKRWLTRLVRTASGAIEVDASGRMHGRGAYLCQRPACWEAATSGQRLASALRTSISEPDRQRLRDCAPQPKASGDKTAL